MRLLAAAAWLVSTAALAWPVEKVIELEPGKDTIVKIGNAEWFEIDEPKIATGESLDSGDEMLLTGKAPGRALLMVYAEGKPIVYALHVGKSDAKAAQSALQSALKACPKLAYKATEYEKLVGDVPDVKCRTALLDALKTDVVEAKETALVFDPTVLAAQLSEIKAAIAAAKNPLALHYEGATLVVEGKAELAQLKRALWEAFKHSACRIALDNRAELSSPPDGGPK
jgi:hypothetical protein